MKNITTNEKTHSAATECGNEKTSHNFIDIVALVYSIKYIPKDKRTEIFYKKIFEEIKSDRFTFEMFMRCNPKTETSTKTGISNLILECYRPNGNDE